MQGFTPVLLNDADKNCCKTLEQNHKNVVIKCCSMTDIDFSEYANKIDLLCGGVPCQSFSQSGSRKGLEDPRGNLLLYFIKIVERVNPKIFLVENVKGLTTHDNGNTFKFIIDEMKKMNYNINYKILNAYDYDVPQKRERIFIIGTRKDLKNNYVFPPKSDTKYVLKDVLYDVPDSVGYEYSEKKKQLFSMIPQGCYWTSLPKDLKIKNFNGSSKRVSRQIF